MEVKCHLLVLLFIVCHSKPKPSQNTPKPHKPNSDYVVPTKHLVLWNVSDGLLSFGFGCFCNVAREVAMVIKWNDFKLKLKAQHLGSAREKISTRGNFF